MEKERNYVGYDYTEVTVKCGNENIYLDNYPNFGWELDERCLSPMKFDAVVLKFKRGRKIQNKTELTRLQRQFESGIKEIKRLKRSTKIKSSVIAYVIGVIAGGFLAGAILCQLLAGILFLTILFGIIGAAGSLLSYAAFALIGKRLAAKVDPIIEHQYDEIYEVCEKASKLL